MYATVSVQHSEWPGIKSGPRRLETDDISSSRYLKHAVHRSPFPSFAYGVSLVAAFGRNMDIIAAVVVRQSSRGAL